MCAAHIPLYLYGFLHTSSKARPFEYLRLTSLGVVGALVKVSDLSGGSRGLCLYKLGDIFELVVYNGLLHL